MPKVFLIMGGCYFVLQLVGILMISDPSEEEAKEKTENTSLLDYLWSIWGSRNA